MDLSVVVPLYQEAAVVPELITRLTGSLDSTDREWEVVLVDDAAIPTPTRMATDAAYEEAGLAPDDLDLVECQDTDAARELLAYEELRLCGGFTRAQLRGDIFTLARG